MNVFQGNLESCLEGLLEGFVAYDAGWVMTYMNASAERMLGRRREDVLGRTWHQAFPHAVGNAVDLMYQRVMRTRTPERMEFDYSGPYGMWFEISASPLSDGGVGVYFRDISEHKHALQALRDVDRRKDEFLATLAHELRNPLAPIANAVEILKAKSPPEPHLVWSRQVIERQLGQMARLLDDLLDVSRITRGKAELRKARVSLAAAIEGAVETSRPLVEAGRHDLEVTLPGSPVILEADAIRLAQVFSNLLNNAAKYTPEGGRIRIHARRSAEGVTVTVADNGIGIEPGMLGTVFEMFAQAEAARERSRGGLGIGLSLARALVEMHGGSIEARSEGPGRGTEFVVQLPALPEAAAREPAAESRLAPAAVKRRLLVADDLRDTADSLAILLRTLGHEVATAYDGESALATAEAFRPDIVLLDLGMPRLSGYDACRRIRERPWGRDTFIIALTGWGQDEDRRQTEGAGFDCHIVKPPDAARLAALLAAGRPPR